MQKSWTRSLYPFQISLVRLVTPNPWLAMPNASIWNLQPHSSFLIPPYSNVTNIFSSINMSTVDVIFPPLDFFSVDCLPSSCNLDQYMSKEAILGTYKSTFALKLYISSANCSLPFHEDMRAVLLATTTAP